jgi:methionine-R-sulfoxide reductase
MKSISLILFLVSTQFALTSMTLASCSSEQPSAVTASEELPAFVNHVGDTLPRLELTDRQWKERLTPQEYDVLRNHGTERPFTGALLDNKENGIYVCKGCGLPLFHSETKFNSGTGWPSYFKALDSNNIRYIKDKTLGMTRMEVRCARCDGHLGHVFDDGPPPTGKRYCVNSVSLDFVKEPQKQQKAKK